MRVCIFIFFVIAFACKGVLASCSLVGEAQSVTYNFIGNSFSIGNSVQNGMNILSQSSRPAIPIQTVECTAEGDYQITREYENLSGLISSGYSGPYGGDVYKTNVKGIGFYMYGAGKPIGNGNFDTKCIRTSKCNTSLSEMYLGVNLVKISEILPDTLFDGSGLPCVVFKVGQPGSMVTVLKACFSGGVKISKTTCDTPSFKVDLGKYSVDEFNKTSANSKWVDSKIKLTNCPPVYGLFASGIVESNGGVNVSKAENNYFVLAINPTNGSSLPSQGVINLTNDSTAKGVGIQLSIGSGESPNPVDLLSLQQYKSYLEKSDGITNYEIPLRARIVKTDDKVTAGNVKGMVTYTIDYY